MNDVDPTTSGVFYIMLVWNRQECIEEYINGKIVKINYADLYKFACVAA